MGANFREVSFFALFRSSFVRYLFVGGINTLFYYLLYAFWIYWGVAYPWAVALANGLGVLFSFFTFGRFVFGHYRRSRFWHFAGIYLCLIPLNIFFVYLFKLGGVDDYLAGLLALIPQTLISYGLNKFFVYCPCQEKR